MKKPRTKRVRLPATEVFAINVRHIVEELQATIDTNTFDLQRAASKAEAEVAERIAELRKQ